MVQDRMKKRAASPLSSRNWVKVTPERDEDIVRREFQLQANEGSLRLPEKTNE
jgi:hypothetical protein